MANNTVVRNPAATVFMPSHDEWYKAAHYKGGGTSAGYWGFPTASDVDPVCDVPGATPNTSICGGVVVDLTDVGSYTASASPYGTFDQGGNVWEWNHDAFTQTWEPSGDDPVEEGISSANRTIRGGSWNLVSSYHEVGYREAGLPGFGFYAYIGFRLVQSTPEN